MEAYRQSWSFSHPHIVQGSRDRHDRVNIAAKQRLETSLFELEDLSHSRVKIL